MTQFPWKDPPGLQSLWITRCSPSTRDQTQSDARVLREITAAKHCKDRLHSECWRTPYLSLPRSACWPKRCRSSARSAGTEGTSPALSTTVHSQSTRSTAGLSELEEVSLWVSGTCERCGNTDSLVIQGALITRAGRRRIWLRCCRRDSERSK